MKRHDKRQDIIRAAEGLFRSRRFHEVKLDDVARKARVGKGTIYLYFKDKDELFFQTATAGFEELCDRLSLQVPADLPFPAQLYQACLEITHFFESRHQVMRLLAESSAGPPHAVFHQRWREHRRRLMSALAKVVTTGVQAGILRKDVAPEVLADFLLGMLRTRAMNLREVPPEQRDFRVAVDLFCNGAGTGKIKVAEMEAGA